MKKILNKIYIAMFVFIIVTCISNISRATELTSDYYKIDNQKNIISVIEPETSIEEFKSKFNNLNNEIHVYKNLELTQEVTSGLVGTGMYLKCENKVYELSVVGDLDGDGKATQVELTNTIRHIVGLQGATLEGIRYISADLTLDGQVDQRDITKYIRYIVYGELDLGKVDKIPDATETGAIIFSPIKWNSGKAEVTISTNKNYIIEYQVNGTTSNWIKATAPKADVTATGLNHNDIIYARLTNGTNHGNYTTLTITDNIAPNIQLTTSVKSTTEITATANATDNETGIDTNAKYAFYIKEENEDDTKYKLIQNTTSKTCNFTQLTAGNKYTIKVEIQDKAGNKTIKTVTETVDNLPDGTSAGNIIFSNVIWENGKAKVEISTNTNYIIEYQVNGTTSNWTKGTQAGAKVTVTGLNHNDTIYARLTDGTNSGQYVTMTIKDTIPPQVNITTTSDTSEITATVTSQDNESGIDGTAKYTYYIKETGEPESSYVQKGNTTSSTYTFTGLKQDTDYTIKVEIEDKAGNKGIKEISETTRKIPDGTEAGSIIFSNVTWTNGQAEVRISTNTNYIIEYQVNSTSGTWTKGTAPKADILVTGLNHNDIIYARLTDGKVTGNYCSITIVDTISPNVNLQLQAQNQTIDATVIATDNESGIDTNATYTFYMKETGADDSTYVQKQNTTQKTLSIQNLTVGKNYTIKVETQDKAGNKGIQEKSILIPDDIAPVVTLTKTAQTSSTITIEANATDVGGLPDPTIYIFYIKETGADDSTYIQKQSSTNKTYTFTGLNQDKDYTIKVEVADVAGNIGKKEMSVLTDQIPDATTAGSINFENIVWNNGKAEVTINTNTTYEIEYQVNSTSGTWTKGTAGGQSVKVTGLNHNDIIYARLTDGTNSSNTATLTVIDVIKPTVTLNATANGTSEIVATANATDNETGIDTNATYKFYIKEPNGTYVEKQNTTSKTCTFTGLKQGTNYTIKVEVSDKAGNIGIKEMSVLTEQIPDATTSGAITFGTVVWNNGQAEVTISTNTNYIIEYQINSTSGTWTKGTAGGQSVKVTGLNHNDIIYARLTDGTNSGQYATLTVVDTIPPEVFTIKVSNASETSIKIKGSTTDAESGIKDYSYYVKKSDGTVANKKEHTTDTSYEVTGLTTGTEYTVYMIACDNALNETNSEEKKITVQAPLNFVEYDAGDWTKAEIQSLQALSLYNINTSKSTSSTSGLNFTFGGFTYKGDTTNESYISNGTVITSRNQSVSSFFGSTEQTPKYSGWQILSSYEENGKTYVTKLVHAGCPENFAYYQIRGYDDRRVEYILSSGLRQTGYATYKPRSWQMYVDNNQKNLIADTTDKDGNAIKDIHAMTYDEALAITGSYSKSTGIRNTGSSYWLATAHSTIHDGSGYGKHVFAVVNSIFDRRP